MVSSSANAERVITAAGLTNRFDAVVDGLVARRLGLAGKPAPDTFLEAARQLVVAPGRAIVLGLVLAAVLGAANVYLGLKVGMTVSASIPGVASGSDASSRTQGFVIESHV